MAAEYASGPELLLSGLVGVEAPESDRVVL